MVMAKDVDGIRSVKLTALERSLLISLLAREVTQAREVVERYASLLEDSSLIEPEVQQRYEAIKVGAEERVQTTTSLIDRLT